MIIYKYSEMYVKLIDQLLTILEKSYIGSYCALKNGSPLIFYQMDFFLQFWQIFDDEHLLCNPNH